MNKVALLFLVLMVSMLGCNGFNFNNEVEIPEFDFPETVDFQFNLSAYKIFQGTPSDLIPAEDFELLELSSILYTDYAKKQRLVKVPEGEQITRLPDGSIDFPDGTILTKTFYYYNDERDTSLGKRIIETRLLIKESDVWNIATYTWNAEQTEATLELQGTDTQVDWVNSTGNSVSTVYHVPDANECIACHQSSSTMIPLGTKLRNLNRTVERNGTLVNQITHLQSLGFLSNFPSSAVASIVDYNEASNSLSDRGRAYLDLNCAHCHSPNAWDIPSQEDFDFRYETSFSETGISSEIRNIRRQLQDREMPFIGTTILDQEGVELVVEYLESL